MKKQTGFTLLELLVIISITGILAVVITNIMVTFVQVKYASDVQNQLQTEANFAADRIESLLVNSNQIPDICWQNKDEKCNNNNMNCGSGICDGSYVTCGNATYTESSDNQTWIVLDHSRDQYKTGVNGYLSSSNTDGVKSIDFLCTGNSSDPNENKCNLPGIENNPYYQAIYLQAYENPQPLTAQAQIKEEEGEENTWLNPTGQIVVKEIKTVSADSFGPDEEDPESGEYYYYKKTDNTNQKIADRNLFNVLYLTSESVAATNLNFYCQVANPTSPINRSAYAIFSFTLSKRKQTTGDNYDSASEAKSFETYTVTRFVQLKNTNS